MESACRTAIVRMRYAERRGEVRTLVRLALHSLQALLGFPQYTMFLKIHNFQSLVICRLTMEVGSVGFEAGTYLV